MWLKMRRGSDPLAMDDVPRAVPSRVGWPFGIPNKVFLNDVPFSAVRQIMGAL